MTTVSIIGKGNMGGAIASIVTAAGITPQIVDQGQDDVAVTGDIVVLAVPHPAVAEIISARGAELAGKVVVDITNPVNFETFDSLVVPADSSKAAEIATALPDSKVVKAFNTTFAGTLAAGTVGGETTTVIVAGDDADAKDAVKAFVTASGLKVKDAGALKRARELEAFGFLQIGLAASEQVGWTGGFAVVA